jgi:hypothetical protein
MTAIPSSTDFAPADVYTGHSGTNSELCPRGSK